MDITLVRSANQRKNPRLVIFTIEGRSGSVQFFKSLFAQDAVPDTLKLSGTFAPPKVKETPEQRKARLKAMTPAEKLARMEKRLAKMRAQVASAPQAAPTPKAAKASSGQAGRKGK